AMILINETDHELYECIQQIISTLGFYKRAEGGYYGGTIASAIGLIWLDPRERETWTVEFMAEQIVHEFIHTTLSLTELVHSTYSNYRLVEEA
ncbi:unnamed protein product, partial [Rotaria sp. Silwood1]